MADTLHLEIVTAGGAAVDTQAQQVTLPSLTGKPASCRATRRCSARS
ncbi:MAG: hypothetical protein ACLTR5_07095 [Oscillospiraceae bacterium]